MFDFSTFPSLIFLEHVLCLEISLESLLFCMYYKFIPEFCPEDQAE